MRLPHTIIEVTDVGGTSDSPLTAAYPGTPHWVTIAGIIAAFVILLFGLVHVTAVAPRGHAAPMDLSVHQP